ncbi:MAG: riboflavin synthase [Burkholderiaceae bacterium]
MFTGIIAAVGRITRVVAESTDPRAGVRLTIDAGDLPLDGVSIGDSIAISGACMTVVVLDGTTMQFDVSRESLARTAGLDAAGEVNLEKALRFGDRLDGHLVSGHVDGTGTVVRFESTGESWTLIVRASRALARFIALKGSIAIDGVSLTINAVDDHDDGCDFAINLIPHTVAVTTLRSLVVGHRVNLEIDTIARYVERMLGSDAIPQATLAAA